MRPAASTSEPRRRALAAGIALLIAACQPAPALREERLHVFGSIAELTLRDADPAAAQAALAEASALLSRYQREWHPWEDSDLTRINAAFARGEAAVAPASVHDLVERSRPLVEASDGASYAAWNHLLALWTLRARDADRRQTVTGQSISQTETMRLIILLQHPDAGPLAPAAGQVCHQAHRPRCPDVVRVAPAGLRRDAPAPNRRPPPPLRN